MAFKLNFEACVHLSFLAQKRDGLGTLTSTSDKSSGVKSVSSTPSTPQAKNYVSEARRSHSLPMESPMSADHLSGARDGREDHDNLLDEETPLVCDFLVSKRHICVHFCSHMMTAFFPSRFFGMNSMSGCSSSNFLCVH